MCVFLCVHESSSLCLPLFVPASRDIAFVLHFLSPSRYLSPSILSPSGSVSIGIFPSFYVHLSFCLLAICSSLSLSCSLFLSPFLAFPPPKPLLFSLLLPLLLLPLPSSSSPSFPPFSLPSPFFLLLLSLSVSVSLSLSHSKILCDSAPITSFHLK